jgi:pimeloyl-ACP methyl ester carboxylesterase
MKNSMLKLLKGLTIAYFVVCLLLFVFQRKLIYFPVDDFHLAEDHAAVVKLEDVTLRGWALNTSAENALIYYGGNAEAIEYNIQRFQDAFPDYAIFLIAYRGYGASEGTPSESALYADALAVFDKVAAKHKSVSLVGRSLGSGVATYVAANRQAEKLVLITPFDSIVALAQQLYPFLPVQYVLLDRYESIARVSEIDEPTLILVAEYDQVVPRANSSRLERAFQEGQLRTVLIKGARHNSISGYNDYWSSMADFL